MELTTVAVVAGLVAVYALVAGRLEATSVTGPIVFVGAGLLLGTAGLDVVELDPGSEGLRVLTEVTLALILFVDAVRIDPHHLRNEAALPVRLLVVGFPLTVVAGALLGTLLLDDVGLALAALMAVTLTPTDAALGQAVVSDPQVPGRIRQALNVESGLNDGLAVPLVTILLAVVAAEAGRELEDTRAGGDWVVFVVRELGVGATSGVVLGAVGAWALARAARAGWVTGASRQVFPLGIALLAWSLTHLLGGNGFIAAFVAGLVFGAVAPAACHDVTDFTEDEGELLSLVVFLVFGASMLGPTLREGLSPSLVVYAVASLTIVRLVPVGLAVLGAGLRAPTTWFLGWFGPRGLASIVLGLQVSDELGGAQGAEIERVVSVVVGLSVLAHGLSAQPAARTYGRWVSARRGGPAASEMVEDVPVLDRPLGRASPRRPE